MTNTTRRMLRFAGAASAAALILAGGLVEPRGRGVGVELASGVRAEVGAWWVGGSLWSVALAQAGQTVTLDDVTIAADTTTYRIPRIVVEGTNLPREGIAALFDSKALDPLHVRLERFSAKRITVPELEVEQKVGKKRSVYTYRNITLDDIVSGRIALGSAETAAFEVKEDGESVGEGQHGRMSVRDIDLAYAARLYGEAAPGPVELRPLYGNIMVENLVFTDDENASIRMGRISADDVRARQTNPSWGDLSKAIAAVDQSDKASKENGAKAMRLLGEVFGAMSVGALEITDVVGTSEEDKDSRLTVSRIAYSGAGAGETRMEGLAVTSEEGSVRLGAMSFSGFSFKPMIDGLVRLAGRSESEISAADMRALVPVLGTVRALDLSLDLPSTTEPDDPRRRNRVGIREVLLDPGPQRNGIPTSFKLAVSNLTADLASDLQDSGLKPLADLGYRAVDLTWTMAAAWREEARELAIDEFALTGRDMGRMAVKARAGNIGSDVFSPDTAVALVALLGASAQGLEVTLQNGGLYERLLAKEARAKRKSPESLRAEYAATATLSIPMALGGSPQARQLGETVGRFLARPGTLRIVTTPKDPAGLGITELMSVDNPLALLQRVDIRATLD
jgi:hypothetical protein